MISQVFLFIPFQCRKFTGYPVCNNEIAGARQNMNIKVAAYVMNHLIFYEFGDMGYGPDPGN